MAIYKVRFWRLVGKLARNIATYATKRLIQAHIDAGSF